MTFGRWSTTGACDERRLTVTIRGLTPAGRFVAAPRQAAKCLAAPAGTRLLATTEGLQGVAPQGMSPSTARVGKFVLSEGQYDFAEIAIAPALNTLFQAAASCSPVHPVNSAISVPSTSPAAACR